MVAPVPTYLVTGATRGIGRCLVDQLAGAHQLIALGRSPTALAQLPVADRVVADLSDPAGLPAALGPLLNRLDGRHGRHGLDGLDGLVHCAGIATRGRLADASVEAWNRHMAINVVAAAELTRLLLPALRAARATIVFVNSGQGLVASPNSCVYAASKFALRALADSLRGEEPEVRVCSVYPGRVATDMQRALRAEEGGRYEPDSYLRPETVAAAIADVLATPPDAVVADITLRPRHP